MPEQGHAPAPDLHPLWGRRRGRAHPRTGVEAGGGRLEKRKGVAVWIRAHARAGAAATLEQEGEGGSGARGSCDALGGGAGRRVARQRSAAAWVRRVRRCRGGGVSGCRNEQTDSDV